MRSPTIVLLALIALASCARLPGCGTASLAEVIEAKGRVERDFAARVGAWQHVEAGAALQRGDGLRTGAGSSALLRVGRNGRLRVESNATIRIQLSGDSTHDASPDVQVESGHAVLEAGDTTLPIRTSFGTAVLKPGSRVQLSRGEHGVRYQVVMGGAAFEQSDGKTAQLRAGQSITVGIGIAVLDEQGSDHPAAAAAAPLLDADRARAQNVALIAAGPHATPASVQAVVRGQVRLRESGEEAWTDLAAGASQLSAGDELEVRADGQADLTRGDEHATLSRGHYQIGTPGAQLVRASDGKLRVSAEHSMVVISVPGGTIVAEPVAGGSRADVVVHGEDGRTEVEVLAGQIKTVGANGEKQLEHGAHATIAASAQPEATAQAAADAQPAAAVQTDAKRGQRAARSAEYAELVVPAGEAFRVYDPAPPTSIGFNVSKHCPDGAEVSIEGLDPVRGTRQVNVLVGPGLRNYRVQCLGESDRRPLTSSLRVMRSDGTRRPPTTPVHDEVDLDGRQYTLMYQNLRPVLDVRWPNAPQATSYTLQLRRPDGVVKSLRAKQAHTTVEPSLLGDGVHALQFTTSGAKPVSSKETKVNLVFDNAAPTASLRQPAPSGFAPGSATTVAGVAVAGSSASIGAQAIPIDKQGRFSAEIPLAPGQHALAVRFRHDEYGTRYYIRRRAGDEP